MPVSPWVTQNVALTPAIQDNLREYARQNDMSYSQVVRRALTVLWRVEGWQSTSGVAPSVERPERVEAVGK